MLACEIVGASEGMQERPAKCEEHKCNEIKNVLKYRLSVLSACVGLIGNGGTIEMILKVECNVDRELLRCRRIAVLNIA